jgi:hypothetical protein
MSVLDVALSADVATSAAELADGYVNDAGGFAQDLPSLVLPTHTYTHMHTHASKGARPYDSCAMAYATAVTTSLTV